MIKPLAKPSTPSINAATKLKAMPRLNRNIKRIVEPETKNNKDFADNRELI